MADTFYENEAFGKEVLIAVGSTESHYQSTHSFSPVSFANSLAYFSFSFQLDLVNEVRVILYWL